MHSMQLLLRQPLHSGLNIVRPSCRSRLPLGSSLPPKKLSLSVRNPATQNFSKCLRCQFRSQSRFFSSKQENDSPPNPDQKVENLYATPRSDKHFSSAAVSEDQRDAPSERLQANEAAERAAKLEDSSLPSEMEKRRSQLSKKLTSIMDDLQSNVFLAGQKLNDLTGYSSIERLKKDIERQGTIIIICLSFPILHI